jgi:elongation factor P
MIDVNELRKGVTFRHNDELFRVLEYSHHKPGRGNATIRTKVRNLRTGATLDLKFTSGDRVEDIRLETSVVQYLYNDGTLLHFMDVETFEQPAVSTNVFGDDVYFLIEGMELKLSNFEGEIISYDLPTTVDQEVTEAEPAVAGDTATGATKQVITSTDLKVQVPLFVEVGDVIRVDTRTGEYVTRV